MGHEECRFTRDVSSDASGPRSEKIQVTNPQRREGAAIDRWVNLTVLYNFFYIYCCNNCALFALINILFTLFYYTQTFFFNLMWVGEQRVLSWCCCHSCRCWQCLNFVTLSGSFLTSSLPVKHCNYVLFWQWRRTCLSHLKTIDTKSSSLHRHLFLLSLFRHLSY